MSTYSIESERSNFTDKELEILSSELNIDLKDNQIYYPLKDGICLFYDLDKIILFEENDRYNC